ncbi:MAG: hypothetical protein ACYCQJ_05650 [Nitrososphaerales archaeon]
MSNASFTGFLHRFVQDYYYKQGLMQLNKVPIAKRFTREERREAKKQLEKICSDFATDVVNKLNENGIRTEDDVSKKASEISRILDSFTEELIKRQNEEMETYDV